MIDNLRIPPQVEINHVRARDGQTGTRGLARSSPSSSWKMRRSMLEPSAGGFSTSELTTELAFRRCIGDPSGNVRCPIGDCDVRDVHLMEEKVAVHSYVVV